MLALGPARAFLARAFNPRPETSPARYQPGPRPGRDEKSLTQARPGPNQKIPGRPAGFLDFFLFFKRISDLEFPSEYQKSKYFSKF